MSLFAIAAFVLVLLLACCWFFFAKAVGMFTADQSIEITMTVPSDAEYTAADAKLQQFQGALRSGHATTVAFTAADLNALIARSPDFADKRGRLRVEIVDSTATLEMSVSIASLQIPWARNRWFNGSARFGFSYEDDEFVFNPEWIEANGHQFSGGFLSSFTRSFNHSFSSSFRDSLEKKGASIFWRNVKTITLEDGQLVITTRGDTGTTI